MVLKSPLNQRKSRLSQEGPGTVIELNQNLTGELFPSTTEQSGGRTTLEDHVFLPALREMLELNDYRVVLVSRSESDDLQRSAVSSSHAAPTVLLSFSWRELLDGVSEFVRHSTRLAERSVAQFADLCVDFIKMEVSRVSGEVITLTNQEFKTLRCLLSSPGRVFSRDELLNEAWGYENYPSTRTVDNHVLRLRQKLERDPARPVHFLTVHSVGYKFVP